MKKSFYLKSIFYLSMLELKSFFSSPTAGFSLLAFSFLNGYLFYNTLISYGFAFFISGNEEIANSSLQIVLSPIFPQAAIALIFSLPLLSMRAFSNAKKGGDFDLLTAWPITLGQIVLSRFMAGFVFLLLLLLIALAPVVILKLVFGVSDIYLTIFGFLGLLLTGLVFLSFGLMASATTPSQPAAIALTWSFLIILWALGWAAPYTSPLLRGILQSLAFEPRLLRFSLGIIYFADLLFLFLLVILGLSISYYFLKIRRFKDGQ